MHTATYSPEDNKLRLYPEARLDPDEYSRVKAAGFIWAPKQRLFVAPRWTPEAEDLLLEWCGEIGDEDTGLVDRAAERAERFEEYGQKRAEEAEAVHATVDQVAKRFEGGQPILVGHHSEKKARKDAERIENGMRKAINLWETSKYWERRAAGALHAAKYKERPDVRARRIKGLEADQRRTLKTKEEAENRIKAWSRIPAGEPFKRKDGTLLTLAETAEMIANVCHLSHCFPLADYPRDPPASQYEGRMGLWSALTGGVITPLQAAELALPAYRCTIENCDRWLSHYANRLTYERAMLQESGGLITDRFNIELGGRVLVRDEWSTILKINKAGGKVNSIRTNARHWGQFGIEEVKDYQPPEAGAVEKVKKAMKLPPLCNYMRPGFLEMTKAEYDRRHQAQMAATKVIKATDEHGAHRMRRAMKDGYSGLETVFITDVPVKEPPPVLDLPAEHLPAPEPGFVPTKKAKFDDDVSEVLRSATFTPDSIELPGQLERDLYVKVNRTLEAAGGHWDRKRKAHVFGQNPRALFDINGKVIKADKINIEGMKAALKAGVKVVSSPQLFPTPPEIAERMVELLDPQPGMCVLEPSGGTGRLIKAVLDVVDTEVLSYEINRELCTLLEKSFPNYKLQVRCRDFLEVEDFKGQYERIIMNPPFENGVDIKHIKHAEEFLAPGGRLVALCAAGPRQQKEFDDRADLWEVLPAGSFKGEGTGVSVAMILLTRPAEEEDVTPDPEKELREHWDSEGVPKEKQDSILADVDLKASPGYMDRFFPCLPGLSQAETFSYYQEHPVKPVGPVPKDAKPEQLNLF